MGKSILWNEKKTNDISSLMKAWVWKMWYQLTDTSNVCRVPKSVSSIAVFVRWANQRESFVTPKATLCSVEQLWHMARASATHMAMFRCNECRTRVFDLCFRTDEKRCILSNWSNVNVKAVTHQRMSTYRDPICILLGKYNENFLRN